MIASCIDQMRQSRCGGCERRDACASFWKPTRFDAPSSRAQDQPFAAMRGAFAAFLSEVAKSFEERAVQRGGEREAPPHPFQREVERRVEPMLAAGDIRIDRVARALGVSRQTLYRRLKAEGTTFARLVDGLRRRIALRLLREEGLPVKEVAYRLGFSDPAAFSRAFKRWTGTSPRDARR